MLKLDALGLEIDSLNEIITKLSNDFKKIYGQNINIEQHTPDGQIISIFSKMNADLQEALLNLYNSFDPDSAVGYQIDKIVKLSAIARKRATKSKVTIEITINRPVSLPAQYTLTDNLNQKWEIIKPVRLTNTKTLVDFQAKKWGAVSASANTIINQDLILLEVDSVTNPKPAILGVDEETDKDLKIRRSKSLEKPSFSTIGGLQANLLNLKNVKHVKIYENFTNSYDSTLKLNAHSIWVIVDGGLISDIFKTIAMERTAGCGLKGKVSGFYKEKFLRSNGQILYYQHKVLFDRPTEKNIFLKINVTAKNPSVVIDKNAIKKKLTEKVLSIGEDLILSELYCLIYQVSHNFIVTSLLGSLDNVTFVSDKLSSGFDEKLVIKTIII